MIVTQIFCSPLALEWLQNNLLPCPFKKFTGFDCPFCGLQRALLALFQGHVSESFTLYPATIPLLIAAVISISGKRYISNDKYHINNIASLFCGIFILGSYLWKVAVQ